MRKSASSENYLDKIASHSEKLTWSQNEDGRVTLHIENKGAIKRLTQILIKKPKVSHIHLDSLGSFVWPLIDGEKSIYEIGVLVEEHFGERAHPTYERLAKYFQVLESNGFITWNEKSI